MLGAHAAVGRTGPVELEFCRRSKFARLLRLLGPSGWGMASKSSFAWRWSGETKCAARAVA